MMNGPRASNERMDKGRNLKIKEDEKKFWKERQKKLETQNMPDVRYSSLRYAPQPLIVPFRSNATFSRMSLCILQDLHKMLLFSI